MAQGVMVFAEVAGGELTAIAKEMLGGGRPLAEALGEPLQAAIVGSGVQEAAQEAIYHGADQVYVADNPVLAQYQTASYTTAMAQIATQVMPNILLVGMSDNGRDLGPRLAFRLHTGLASDCVELSINAATRLLEATRPVSGGNAMATVVIETSRPQMATVRGKTMEPAARDTSRQGTLEAVTVDIDAATLPVKIVERVNRQTENIGARRLYTILERLLDEISFTAPDTPDKHVVIDRKYVTERLEDIVKSEDLSHYIL